MKITLFVQILVSLTLSGARAAEEVAQSFTMDGRLYSDSAATTPLLDTSSLKIQILNPGQTCILYEEIQSVNTTATNGFYTIRIGQKKGGPKRSSGDANNFFSAIFSNTPTSISGKLVSDGTTGCAYTPVAGDTRYLRVTITPSDNIPRTTTSNMLIDAVPSALVAERAETLQGFAPVDFVKTAELGTGANQVVQMTAGGKLPAVDGSLLTSLNPANLSGTVSISKGGTGQSTATAAFDALSPLTTKGDIVVHNGTNNVRLAVGTNGQVLTADSAAAGGVKWAAPTGGADSSYAAKGVIQFNTDAATSGITVASGVATVNAGTGANQIVKLDGSSKLPAVDGSALTGLNAGNISSGTLAVGRGGTGATTFGNKGAVISNLTGSALETLNCTSGQVLSFDVSGYAVCGTPSATGFVNNGNSFAGTATLGTNDNNHLLFETNGNIRVTILADGKVGVGTTNPGSILDVNGALTQRGMAAPAVSASGQGVIYFDSTANKFKVSQDGAAYVDLVGAAGGGGTMTDLNGSSAASQTFATPGTSGNAPNWSTNTGTGVHTLNIPLASTASVTAGLISKTKYDEFDAKLGTASTFSGDLTGTSGTMSVEKIRGKNISPTTYAAGQTLRYNGTQWINATLDFADLSNKPTTLAGYGITDASSNTLADGKIFVGNASNVATAVTMSGDATLANDGILTLKTIPVSKGGTGLTSFSNGRVLTTNSTTGALQNTTCSQYQVISFDASGNWYCANVNSLSGSFVNGGNSFGATAILGTNDTQALAFETDGNTRMTIDATGKIGIGTTSPGAPVDINGSAQAMGTAFGQLAVAANDAFGIDKGGTISLGGKIDGTTNLKSFGMIGGFKETAVNGNEAGYLSFGTRAHGTLPLEKMRITSDGKVGIGSTAPWHGKLQVDEGSIASWASTTNPGFKSWSDNASFPGGVTFTQSRSGGYVQNGDLFGGFDGRNKDNISAGAFRVYASQNHSATAAGGFLTFYTTPNDTNTLLERVRIDQSGNLGIGTVSPNTALDINGAQSMRGIATASAPAVSPAGEGRIYFDSTANKFKVSQNGGAYTDLVGAGGGGSGTMTDLNGSSAASQTFATPGTSGNAPNWSTNTGTGVHTLNIPLASTASVTAGLISNTKYDEFDAKLGTASTFSGDVTGTSGTMSVEKIRGKNISPTTYAAGQTLRYNGTQWINATLDFADLSNKPTTLAGYGITDGASNTLADGKIFVGNGSNVATAVFLSGDATLSNTGNLVLNTVPVTKGGTGLTSLANGRVMTTSGTGTMQATTCSQYQVISFDASGNWYCANVNSLSGSFINGGNSFGATATLGTNDTHGLAFETDGTTRMTIDSTGKVGIGTATPSSALELSGSDNNISNGFKLTIKNTNAGAGAWGGVEFKNDASPIGWLYATSSGYTGIESANRLSLQTDASASGISIFAGEPGQDFRIYAGGNTERFRIGSTGNVGIGQTNPAYRFHFTDNNTETTTGWKTSFFTQTSAVPTSASSAQVINAYHYTEFGGTSNSPSAEAIGILGDATMNGSGTVGKLVAVQGNPFINSGTANNAISFNASMTQTGGTTGSYAGLVVETGVTGGTLQNSYGVVIRDLAGTIDQFGIYQQGATDRNFFAGKVGIGSDAPNSALDVSGAVTQRGMAAPAVSAAGQGVIYFDSTANKFKVSQNGAAYTDLVGGASGSYLSDSGGTVSGNITVSSGGITNTGGLDNNSGGITEAGTISGVTSVTGTGAMTVASGGTNTNLTLSSTGTGSVNMAPSNGTGLSILNGPASTVNYVTVKGAAAAGSPVIGTAGSDTNIDLTFTPKGTGSSVFNGKVGIGTTATPSSPLEVSGTAINGAGVLAVTNTASSTYMGAIAALAPNMAANQGYAIMLGKAASTNNRAHMIYNHVADNSASNYLGLGLYNNDNAMNITGGGKVGIGTTDPWARLDVQETDASPYIRLLNTNSTAARYPAIAAQNYMGTPNAGYPMIQLQNNRGNTGAALPLASGDILGALQFTGATDSFYSAQVGAQILSVATQNFSTGASGSALTFGTTNTNAGAATEKMRITADGDVGIGTNNPLAKFEVVDGAIGIRSATTEPELALWAQSVESHPNTMTFISSRANGTLRPQFNDVLGTIDFGAVSGKSASITVVSSENQSSTNAGGFIAFRTTPNGATSVQERMRIENNGRVGIGTDTPRASLDVSGAIVGTASLTNPTSTIDFIKGNIQHTTANCGSFALHNLQDGGTYMFIVKGTTVATCAFTAYSDAGSSALTVHLPPNHGATTTGKHTIYNLAVSGGDVYLAWTPGY